MRRRDDVEIMREALRGNLFEQGTVKVVRYEVGYAMSPREDGEDAVEVTAFVEPPQGHTWNVRDVAALSTWCAGSATTQGLTVTSVSSWRGTSSQRLRRCRPLNWSGRCGSVLPLAGCAGPGGLRRSRGWESASGALLQPSGKRHG